MEHPARPESGRDAALVEAARAGDRDAFSRLVEAYFDRCWEVSWRILHDRDRAAEVAQDVMLAAWQQLDRLDRPGSFGGWVLRMARNRSLDRLAHERRALPTDEASLLEPRGPVVTIGDPELEAVRKEAHDLVWDAAAALGARDLSILDLHLRHGLEARELAGELGIAANAANQALFRMRARLGTAIRARMLWRGGQPTCEALAAELASAGVSEFGATVVRVVDRHATECDACGEKQRAAVGADAMFAAVPFVVAPLALRAASAQAMASQGVPVPTSWSVGPAAAGSEGSRGEPGTSGDDGAGRGADPAGDELAVARAGAGAPGRLPRRTVNGLVALATLALLAGGGAVVAAALGVGEAPQDAVASSAPMGAPGTQGPAPTPQPVTPGPLVTAVPLPSVGVVAPPSVPPPPPPPTTEEPTAPGPSVTVRAVWIGSGACPTESPFLYRVRWSTTDAEAAVLSGTGGSEVVALDGETQRCGPEIAQFTLTASGPGGASAETADARATPAG